MLLNTIYHIESEGDAWTVRSMRAKRKARRRDVVGGGGSDGVGRRTRDKANRRHIAALPPLAEGHNGAAAGRLPSARPYQALNTKEHAITSIIDMEDTKTLRQYVPNSINTILWTLMYLIILILYTKPQNVYFNMGHNNYRTVRYLK